MNEAKHAEHGPWAVFLIFLRLGLTSFGGPVAHLGYFHAEFVARRRWLDERAYADLVALCQFLPGPASSQVGMALGLQHAGQPRRGELVACRPAHRVERHAIHGGVGEHVHGVGDQAGRARRGSARSPRAA